MLPRALPQSRIPLACVQCRGRHVKCDGAKPICLRCRQLDISCEYHKSRRGGKRRHPVSYPADNVQAPLTSAVPRFAAAPTRSSAASDERSSLSPARSGDTRSVLVDQFYANFYASHPCVLPRRAYEGKVQEHPDELEFLDLVLQFIGSIFHPDTTPAAHEDRVKECMERSPFKSGYDVQALTLYATVVYWRDDPDRSRQLLDTATDLALAIGLNRHQFAGTNSGGNAVLAESWRRTWWQLYITDAHVTAIGHAPVLRTSQKNVPTNVELPCEEHEYLAGCVPVCRTVEEYDNREFDLDGDKDFSSFAYLIGLVRGFDQTILGHQRETSPQAKSICINADCAVESWLMLLPAAKRRVITEDGTLDELIFKAMLMIPVYVVDMHRSLSTLEYDEIESVSSCSPRPPPQNLTSIFRREAPIHTSKILHSIGAMMEVLLLPSKMTLHSPFIICMISSTTIAHLSACKHILHGEPLRSARERVKVAMGALSSLAEVWPSAQRILHEVKVIARHTLGLGTGHTSKQTSCKLDDVQCALEGDSDATADLGAGEDWSLFNDYTFTGNVVGSPYDLLSGVSGLIPDVPLGAVGRAVGAA